MVGRDWDSSALCLSLMEHRAASPLGVSLVHRDRRQTPCFLNYVSLISVHLALGLLLFVFKEKRAYNWIALQWKQLGVLALTPSHSYCSFKTASLYRSIGTREHTSLNMKKIKRSAKPGAIRPAFVTQVGGQRLARKWALWTLRWRRPECSNHLLTAAINPRRTEPATLFLCCFCTDSWKWRCCQSGKVPDVRNCWSWFFFH